MAEKEKNKLSIINLLSFFALVGLGIVLVLTAVGLFSSISTIIRAIADLIAYGLIAYNAFYYVRKKSTAYKIIYAVALTLIIVGIILPIVKK